MKTRTFHTRFWSDEFVVSLDRTTRYIFNFLITNEKVSITGYYEMSDRDIKYFAQVDQSELDKAKEVLSKNNKVLFYKGWIRLVNADKYNSYNGEKLQVARAKELSYVPKELIEGVGGIDTSIDTSIHTPNKHNNKHKQERGMGETKKYSSISDIEPEDIQHVAQMYGVREDYVAGKVEAIRLFCQSKGKTYKNYLATLQNWVRGDKETGKAKLATKLTEMPDMPIQTAEERERSLAKAQEIKQRILAKSGLLSKVQVTSLSANE